jgi:hypothetical protein
MKYFTDEVVNFDADTPNGQENWDEACRLNHLEYLKAKERLPKSFVSVFEKTHCFDDAHMVDISIVTERALFTYGQRKCPPSLIRMIFVDYDNHELVWEILISGIRNASAEWIVINDGNAAIDCIDYDELCIEDSSYLSWEMAFVGGLRLKVVFKHIRIRQLPQKEIEKYRQPIRKSRKT